MKKLITLAAALCFAFSSTQAAVIYNNFSPDLTMAFGSTLSFDLDGDMNDDITFSTSGSGSSDYVINVSGSGLEFANQNGGSVYTETLFIGKLVDAQKNWVASNARIASAMGKDIAGSPEFFIGVRVAGSNNNYFYGWILVELKSNLELVVKSTAFETSSPRIVVGNTGAVLLSQDELEAVEFSVYPNRVDDILNLQSSEDLKEVILFSTNGSEVLRQSLNAQTARIQVAHLPKGMYLIKAQTIAGVVLEERILKL